MIKTRYFLAPLLAALLLGSPASAPRLAEVIPREIDAACDYDGALNSYLLAYAYARENQAVAAKFLSAAEAELGSCTNAHAVLKARLRRLRTLPP